MQWTEAARTEIRKASFSQAMMHPHERKYKWVQPQHVKASNGHHRHDVVPMDPTFTRVNRAVTEADKERYKEQGRCYNCDQRGHMAADCPNKKRQQFSNKPKSKFKPKQSDQSGQGRNF